MTYALGSHKLGIRGSTNLHTREKFNNENRELIPEDPSSIGLTLKTFEMTPDDMLIHDGFTWHYSGPNIIPEYTRRGLSVRFIVEDAYFDPRPGQGAAFTSQIDCAPGDLIVGPPFPYL
jgi:ectoine hydroxylase-related dioxygenase (phytanoyl-CoA dioxygenase family)